MIIFYISVQIGSGRTRKIINVLERGYSKTTLVIAVFVILFVVICHVCQREAGGAHKCAKCQKKVHVICGTTSPGEEGYGCSVICKNCEKVEEEAGGGCKFFFYFNLTFMFVPRCVVYIVPKLSVWLMENEVESKWAGCFLITEKQTLPYFCDFRKFSLLF